MTEVNTAHDLASVQQVIWLDQMLNPDIPHYNIGARWDITGELDVARLEAAIQEVVDAHDALRIVLYDEAGIAVQRVLPRVTVGVRRIDLSAHADAEDRARAYLQEIGGTPFAQYGALLWEETLGVATNHAPSSARRSAQVAPLGTGVLLIAGDPARGGLRAVEFSKAALPQN